MPISAARATQPGPTAPSTLGRYRVERELGRGGQGCVYLAQDSQLQRPVAIKTLMPGHDPARATSLLAEARTTAQLQHRNIVTLHDAFEHEGLLCLVFEYLPGDTLEHHLRATGRLDAERAVWLAIQILDGLAYAHARGIVHRDIKPSNVWIDAAGDARIMDFGIAAAAGKIEAAFPSAAGTPRYMAPEAFDNREVALGNDVFSVGMTLYEMLAGRPAVEGRNVFEVLHKVANEPFQPPSAFNADIGEALDQIVMRAIAKDPTERYTDAAQMRSALDHYVRRVSDQPGRQESTADGGRTVEFLLARMRRNSSFPALSGTISAINRVTSGAEQNIQALSDVLLKDFALTNKLLKLVNSSGYGQFGGTISTISRAVLIIGFDAVRDLAITLVLFEHLQNKTQASTLRDDVIRSLLTGMLARRLARTQGVRDAEEGFLCGVFRHLGRLLASFYLYEESVEIARLIRQSNLSEAEASKRVLGASYDDIGIAVARAWNLPPGIVAAMRPVAEECPEKPGTGPERLRLIAAMACAMAQAASAGTPAAHDELLKQVARRFRNAANLDEKALAEIASEGLHELLEDATYLLGDARTSRFCESLRETAGESRLKPCVESDPLERMIEQTKRILAPSGAATESDPAQVLAAGIQDISNSLAEHFNLNDLLRIILETMYRGMGLSRVMLFMRTPGTLAMTARFGYGSAMDRLISRLTVPFGREQDVFSVALAKNVDLLISDVDAANIRERIPAWFRAATLGHTFVLLPLVIERKPVGLFYGDKPNPGDLVIDQRELNLLKTLRNQAVLALRQRR